MSIEGDFAEFDADNPEVYEMFCRFAAEAHKAGHLKLSAGFIMHRIRWETNVVMHGKYAGGFKINDHWTPYYARKFLTEFPHYGRYFELRDCYADKAFPDLRDRLAA